MIENAEIARLFRRVADLLEIQEANRFRVRAYRNGARTVENYAGRIAELAMQGIDALDRLPGIGEDLAAKIEEIVRTGNLGMIEELEKGTPRGASALMSIPGVGAKRAAVLAESLGVESIAELETAAREGRVAALPGFGKKSERKLLHELEERHNIEQRIPRPVAAQYAESLLEYLRKGPGVRRADAAGSFRRARETVGDLDLLVGGTDGEKIIEYALAYPEVEEVLLKGPTKTSFRLRSDLRIDLRVLQPASYGAALHYFTGSKAHNIRVRRMGQERGLKINEYGVFRGDRRIAGRTEKEVFDSVGLPWIPPELREDDGEIEAAERGELPELLTLQDIRGDLQCHTRDSDGRDTLERMARAAENLGYDYLAITDHTPAVRVAGGMDRDGFRRQMKQIDRLNAELKKLTVLKGAEVDILPDGSLDLDDETLHELDIVLVALHAGLNLPRPEQTRRVVRALQHPAVNIFAHPTGRRLGKRRGADFDEDEVFRAAADNNVVLEIDAQPERLDLSDQACRRALRRGLRIAISTDAHSTDGFSLMRWGVDQARRAWATRAQVINTHALPELMKILKKG